MTAAPYGGTGDCMVRLWLLWLLFMLLICGPVLAQSNSNWPSGFKPSAAQWQASQSAKVDVTNGASTGQALSSPTITGGTLSGTDISGANTNSLPTTQPAGHGVLWNNGGVLSISP